MKMIWWKMCEVAVQHSELTETVVVAVVVELAVVVVVVVVFHSHCCWISQALDLVF